MSFSNLTTPDQTMVVLLLCSSLGRKDGNFSPLSAGEFYGVINALASLGIDLTELPKSDLERISQETKLEKISPTRLEELLGRGATLTLILESLMNKGIWVISSLDETYPERLRSRLGKLAPPILYGIGDVGIYSTGGLVIVGSRDVDEDGMEFTRLLARKCAREGITVISGGARGVDKIAMQSALEESGKVAGILAADFERVAVNRENRNAVIGNDMVLATPYNPGAGFDVGNAMGRNKIMYALGDWAVVVSSDENKGGTWAGATENMKSSYRIPIFVRDGKNIPPGNTALLKNGCIAISDDDFLTGGHLIEILSSRSEDSEPGSNKSNTCKGKKSSQLHLF